MFKYIITSMLCFSTVLAADNWVAGDQWFDQIQDNFDHGRYKQFLQTEEEAYQIGLKKGDWQPLFDKEKELEERAKSAEGKKSYEQIAAQVKEYNDELDVIKKERDEALKKIGEQHPDSTLAKMIKARFSGPRLSDEQKAAYEQLEEWLSPFPLHEPTPLLTDLKKIVIEYRIKEAFLKLAHERNDEFPAFGKINKELYEEYRIALTLEKLNRMLEAAKKTKETDFIDNLSEVVASYPTVYIEQHDGEAIEDAALQAKNKEAKQVADILESYRSKQRQLQSKYGIKG